jgi:hypothetical protein
MGEEMKDYTYLGDGVYARRDEFGSVVLVTYDGVQITNEIWLDPQLTRAVKDFLNTEAAG